MLTAVAIAMAVVRPASANYSSGSPARIDPGRLALDDHPTFVIGTPSQGASVTSAKLAVDQRTNASIVRMELVLATSSTFRRDIETTLSVPSGARVVDMAVTIGRGRRLVSTARLAHEAAGEYQRIITGRRDPGLLSHAYATSGYDVLSLHAFPVKRGDDARVQLTIVLPPLEAVSIAAKQTIPLATIDTGTATQRFTNLLDGRRVALSAGTRAHDPSSLPGEAVDPETSLLAADEPIHVLSWPGCTHANSVSVDKKTIRRMVKRAMPRLIRCYTFETERDPSIVGTAVLHFTIGLSGAIDEVTVDGSVPSERLKTCMANEVKSWRFHEQDILVQAHYPLDLRMSYW